ncbi:MAG TPA: MFS transporter [Acidimicrobiia bacterium]|nr:MFS transporter [Acidimicrobiia bacterium]
MTAPALDQRFRFGRLWTAAVASNLGDGLVLVAFPLLAASITSEPLAIAGITIVAGLPWLIFGAISGALVDRFDRRVLMVWFDSMRAVAVSVFAGAVWAEVAPLWSLYLVVAMIAAGETVVDTSAQSLLPALVPKSRLDLANGRLFSTMIVAHRFVGPPLGGFLFAAAAVLPFVADSATFAVAAVLMFGLRGRFRPESADLTIPQRLAGSIKEGLVWLWREQPIRTFAIGAALLNIGIMAGEAILVLYASEELGLGGVGFGALFVASAAGYAAGSALAPLMTARRSRLRIVSLSVGVIAMSLFGIGLTREWAVATVGLFAIGVASGLWDVIAVSYRQAAVPDRLRGRIMAAYRMIAHGSVPVGALLGGLVATLWDPGSSFVAGGLVVLGAVFYVAIRLRGVELDPSSVTPR